MEKVSLIITVFNEENTIENLLDSIALQSQLPDEIIIVDAFSTDKTRYLIKNWMEAHTSVHMRLLKKRGNRSVGRNYAIEKATYENILVTDAGCILDVDWVLFMKKAFAKKRNSISCDFVKGFYKATGSSAFQECMGLYTSTIAAKLHPQTFLPSSRSVGFKKRLWESVNGYPEEYDTAEDLVFAKRLAKSAKYPVMAQKAIVYWEQKRTFSQAFHQFFMYARGDGKALYIRKQTPLLFGRYFIGLVLLLFGFYQSYLHNILFIGILLYGIWAIVKNINYTSSKKALFILPTLQCVADFAVMSGMSLGFFERIQGNTVIRNTVYQVLGRLCMSSFGIITVMLLTRSLGVTDYGSYSFVLSLVGIAFLISDFGFDPLAIRSVASSAHETKSLIETMLSFRLFSGFVTAFLLYFVLSLTPTYATLAPYVLVASIGQILLISSSLFGSIFQGKEQFKTLSQVYISVSFVQVVLVLIGFIVTLPLPYFISTYVMTHLFGYVLLRMISKRYMKPISYHFRVKEYAQLLKKALPFAAGSIVSVLYLRFDIVILSYFYPPEVRPDVGIYALAYKPFEVATVFLGFTAQALFPVLSRQYGKQEFVETIKRYSFAVITGSIGVSIVFYFAAPLLITILGGKDFLQSIQPLQILACALAPTAIASLFLGGVIAASREKQALLVSGTALLVNVILNIILIPEFSYIATAWTTVISQTIIMVGYGIGLRKIV